MNADGPDRRAWYSAIEPYVERSDLKVQLKRPIRLPAGEIVEQIDSLFLRFPQWTGSPFVDDFGKKSAAMVDIDGVHLFAELAVVRLLEKKEWQARWVNTYSGRGEVWKYLREWRDVPRRNQVSKPILDRGPRELLSRIAAAGGRKRFTGCWDTFGWRGGDVAFFELKRQAPKYNDIVKREQEDWLRAALQLNDPRLSLSSFCVIQWDYR